MLIRLLRRSPTRMRLGHLLVGRYTPVDLPGSISELRLAMELERAGSIACSRRRVARLALAEVNASGQFRDRARFARRLARSIDGRPCRRGESVEEVRRGLYGWLFRIAGASLRHAQRVREIPPGLRAGPTRALERFEDSLGRAVSQARRRVEAEWRIGAMKRRGYLGRRRDKGKSALEWSVGGGVPTAYLTTIARMVAAR